MTCHREGILQSQPLGLAVEHDRHVIAAVRQLVPQVGRDAIADAVVVFERARQRFGRRPATGSARRQALKLDGQRELFHIVLEL